MKRLLMYFLLFAPLTMLAPACSDNDLYNEMPEEILQFVAQYYPNTQLEEFTHSGDIYHLRLRHGPGMTFGKDYEWIAVNGYGQVLPQVFLFDCLPPALYEYLQSTESTDQVYSVDRDTDRYTVMTLNDTIVYERKTGRITESD